jgi:L-ribulose-5-phosphate 4-epimerase
VSLTFGNASELDRSEGAMAIKPSGVPYAELTPESIVIVDLDTGRVVDGEQRPSSDTPTHLALYRSLSSIGGVAHTHSPFATAWAQALREIPCLGTTHADHFRGAVPVTRALTREEIEGDYEERTGDVILEALASLGLDALDMPAALVASHGPFTWGVDAGKAVEDAIALEVVAALAHRTSQLSVSPEPVANALLDRHHSRKHGPDAYYGQVAR